MESDFVGKAVLDVIWPDEGLTREPPPVGAGAVVSWRGSSGAINRSRWHATKEAALATLIDLDQRKVDAYLAFGLHFECVDPSEDSFAAMAVVVVDADVEHTDSAGKVRHVGGSKNGDGAAAAIAQAFPAPHLLIRTSASDGRQGFIRLDDWIVGDDADDVLAYLSERAGAQGRLDPSIYDKARRVRAGGPDTKIVRRSDPAVWPVEDLAKLADDQHRGHESMLASETRPTRPDGDREWIDHHPEVIRALLKRDRWQQVGKLRKAKSTAGTVERWKWKDATYPFSATLLVADKGGSVFWAFTGNTVFRKDKPYGAIATVALLLGYGTDGELSKEDVRKSYHWLREHYPGCAEFERDRYLKTTEVERAVEQSLQGELVDREIEAPDRLRYSDKGNAERLLRKHGDRLRFVETWGKWICFDGGRWSVDPMSTTVAAMAAEIGEDLLTFVASLARSDKALNALRRHVKASESAGGVAATLSLARSGPGVAISHELLDSDPWLLAVANGVLDLKSGELLPDDPRRLITLRARAGFDAAASRVLFESFMSRIAPDPEVQSFLKRLFGSSLVGEQLDHVLPLFIGNGANGKSTLTRIIASVLGDYAGAGVKGLFLAKRYDQHPTDRAALFRKRFVYIGEIPEHARLDEATVKELTGGDEVLARRMGEDFWSFRPSHTLIIHANHRPVITGTDDGIWRRVLLVDFPVRIPDCEIDPTLPNRIIAEESDGVLAWLVEGLADWRNGGLRPPASVRAATNGFRSASDTVGAFLSEVGLGIVHGARYDSSELAKDHAEWFAQAGLASRENVHYQSVVTRLKSLGAATGRTGKRRYWENVGFVFEPTATEAERAS